MSDAVMVTKRKRFELRLDEATAMRPQPIAPHVIGEVIGYVGSSRLRPVPAAPAHWYVLELAAGEDVNVAREPHDARFARTLMRLGVRLWVPREPRKVRAPGMRTRYRVDHRPIIPGYGFAGCDLTDELWHELLAVAGVRGILMFDGRPVPVGENEFARLRHQEQAAHDGKVRRLRERVLKVGMLARITDGPFNGFLGTVSAVDHDGDQVTVELDIFARATPITLESENVEVVDA